MRGRSIAFVRQESGDGGSGTGPLALCRLAPRRRGDDVGRRRDHDPESPGKTNAIVLEMPDFSRVRGLHELKREAGSRGTA